VFDTTGVNPAVRKAAVTIARKHGAGVSASVLDTPVNVCVQSQQGRANPVAAADVRRIHADVQRQTGGLKAEGFQAVNIVRNRK
jgi:predicted kinase